MERFVFFDLDGTLLDYHAAVNRRLAEVHRRSRRLLQGIPQGAFIAAYWAVTDALDRAYLASGARDRPQEGAGAELRFARTLERLGRAEPDAAARLAALYRSAPLDSVPFPGLAVQLGLLARRAGLAVLTEGPAATQRRRLARAGLDRWFPCLISAADLGLSKPDPELLRRALETAGAAPGAVMVGDHPILDLVPARAAGLRTVLVTYGRRLHHHPELYGDVIDRVVPSVAQLAALVSELLESPLCL